MPDTTRQIWNCRDREFQLEQRPLIMGILNVTPDSFSDGGKFTSNKTAVDHANDMIAQGADIIDVGGESTRPGAEPVSADEEIARVIPVIQQLAQNTSAVISIDTTKAMVAEAAMHAGTHIINDISGLTREPAIKDVVRRYKAGLVIMHMQGDPKTMQNEPHYEDVVKEVSGFLKQQVEDAVQSGIAPGQIVVDPGIGFGKTLDHNVDLLRHIDLISKIAGRPVLIGVSRKRFIGTITGKPVNDRLAGSLAAMAFAIMQGAQIIRVHDVKESCDVLRMMATLTSSEED